MVVFDAQSAISPGWVRISALRQTKLPVGVRIWNPAEGFVVDAIITCSKEHARRTAGQNTLHEGQPDSS